MSRLATKLKQKIFYEIVDGVKVFPGSLDADTKDRRDINVGGIFGWLGLIDYKPKHQSLILSPLEIKNQSFLNTCGWVSVTTDKENSEKILLSQKGVVKRAKKEGLLSGDGFSQLRDNMKVINKWGAPEQHLVAGGETVTEWEEYSKWDLTEEAVKNAETHKSASYAQINEFNKRNETLKALDEGLMIHTGAPWYSGFNMRGGFESPWLITEASGYLIGGHAFEIIGYNLNYQGRKVYVCLNSYGTSWGDNGKFYIDMDYGDKLLYSRWTQLDIPVDTARFLSDYNDKNVRGRNSKSVWHITAGKKFAYPNWLTFLAYGGLKEEILVVDDAQLASVERGPDMRIETSPYWPIIKEMSAPDNYKKLIEITTRVSTVETTFSVGSIQEKIIGLRIDGSTITQIYDEMLSLLKS